ncbi:MAG TPA: glycoside hydrolase family 38 C-terminal domain-containing protein [bacterium]|nr:glycoside hydrolase family 38 C-terminal domain-containing protein [bacterium]
MASKRTPVSRKSFAVRTAAAILFLLLPVVSLKAADSPNPRKCDPHKDKVLYVVGYAHLDTQWRWTYQDSINQYIPNTMHFNFDLLDKYPDYRFNFTGVRRYAMMKEYYPKDYERVKDYIAKGRWFISGSSVDENDANVPAPESVIRHVLYGNHWFNKEFGKTSVDYMLPDCFGFAASLPSALAHAGLKGFSTQKLTWGSPIGIPFNVGVWEGPDGNSVAVALNPGGYSSKVSDDLSNDLGWLKRIEDTGAKSGFYADFKYYGTGDIGGSPTEGSVIWIEKSVNGNGPVCVASDSSDRIFRDITPTDYARLPRYKGDLLLREHSAGSLTSQAYMKRWNRKNELLIDNAERASVIADWLGGADYQLDRLTKTWNLILGNQMHDILPGTAVPKAYEFSWNDEVIAMNSSASVFENAAGATARMLDTQVKGIPVIVYNPLAIAREDIAKAKINFAGAAPAAVRVYAPDGKEVPSQIINKNGGAFEIAFLAKAPSVGFAVYDVSKSDKPCSMATGLKVTEKGLENKAYRVRLDGNGDVASIFDKTTGRELLSGPAQFVFLEDSPREYPAWNVDWDDRSLPPLDYVHGPAKVRIAENGPARVSIEVTRVYKGSTYVQNIRLSAGGAGDRLEFDNALDWRTQGACLKVSFPMAATNRMASYNLGMGVIERPNNDSGKYEVPSRQWFDLTDAGGGFGAAVLEDSKFGSDKPDDNTVRLTLVRTPKCRDYQDQATQDLGRHNILYAIAGHKNDWRESGITWRGARLNQPLVTFTAPAHKGVLGKSFSFLKVSSAQVGVSALKKAEDGDEIIVRLQELVGKSADGVKVSFAAPIISAREVNGQEQEIGNATIENGSLVFEWRDTLPARAIRSCAVFRNRDPACIPCR